MNLNDCEILYYHVSARVLRLDSKEALLKALLVYATQSTVALVPSPSSSGVPKDRKTRYQETKLRDIQQQLILKRVLSEDGQLIPIVPEETIMVPVKFNYSDRLSFAGLKTFIACYQMVRYERGRDAFSFTSKREELAEVAGLSLPSLRKALLELEAESLIEINQTWRDGVRVELLDPIHPSGTRLYEIADFNKRQMHEIGVLGIYKLLLSAYDPRYQLKDLTSDVRDYGVICPFCGGGEQAENKKRFRINVVDDQWFCHNCKRGGDSARLWGRLIYRVGKEWRPILNEVTGGRYETA